MFFHNWHLGTSYQNVVLRQPVRFRGDGSRDCRIVILAVGSLAHSCTERERENGIRKALHFPQ